MYHNLFDSISSKDYLESFFSEMNNHKIIAIFSKSDSINEYLSLYYKYEQ